MQRARLPRTTVKRRLAGLVLAVLCAGAGGIACDARSPLEQISGLLTGAEVLAPAQLVARDDPRAWPTAPWEYLAHRLDGDTLSLDIQFAGGCASHRFALLIDPAFMESQPVQVAARLAHDAGGDACRALLLRTLRFDLTRLRERYAASYGAGPGTVVIGLAGQSIRYAF
ncbi:MAG TPA: hypothetical protein PKE51_08820 [Gemmatimonadaceae bacterium]|nr:hypothetical protein [Gemmatimonadaceae bacterium]